MFASNKEHMFHFKQFSVNHLQSTMRVGTDAVLLGAWMPLPKDCKSILEIGSGCGVISLMIAQRTKAYITGVDIDEKSVTEAQINAENSPWKNQVYFIHEEIQHFAEKTNQKFEVIITNPPFFENSLKSPKKNNNISKHNDRLSFETLAQVVDKLLSENGSFGIILPMNRAEKMEKLMLHYQLYVTKKTIIFPGSHKNANRVLILFGRKPAVCKEDTLTIRDKDYTQEYYEFVKEYLTI